MGSSVTERLADHEILASVLADAPGVLGVVTEVPFHTGPQPGTGRQPAFRVGGEVLRAYHPFTRAGHGYFTECRVGVSAASFMWRRSASRPRERRERRVPTGTPRIQAPSW